MDSVLQRTSTSNLRFSYNKGKREKFTKAKNGTILHEYIMCIIKDKRFEYMNNIEGLKMRERRREDLARRRRRKADKEGMRGNEGEMRKTKEGEQKTRKDHGKGIIYTKDIKER